MTRRNLISWLAPTLAPGPDHALPGGRRRGTAGPVALASSSVTAPPRFVRPENDQKLKGKLSKALGKQGILTAAGVQGLMDPSTFAKLAGR